MVGHWHIEMLGGLRATGSAQVITRFRTQKTASLLAYLAYKGEMVPREVVCGMLWPEARPDPAHRSLCTCLCSLRHQFEPPGVARGTVFLADRFGIAVNPEAVTVDARDFIQLIEKSEACKDKVEGAHHLRAAVSLYRGELLPGFYEPWVIREQEYLSERFFSAAHRVIEILARSGETDAALRIAQHAVRVDPFVHEDIHRDLIGLLAASGQVAEALKESRALEQALRERLNQSLSPATEELFEEVTRLSRAGSSPDGGIATGALRPMRIGTLTVAVVSPADADGWTEADTEELSRDSRVYRGRIARGASDAQVVLFARSLDAVSFGQAVLRRATNAHAPPRIVLHAGDVRLHDGECRGECLERARALVSAGEPGKLLCSEAVAALVRHSLSPDCRLVELGLVRLHPDGHRERLFELAPATAADGPVSPGLQRGTATVPMFPTRFVGRAKELEDLRSLLREGRARFVTVTGAGGAGKSRLAVEVARSLQAEYCGRVWFVPLGNCTHTHQAANTLLRTLDPSPTARAGGLHRIAETLGTGRALLVLDNVEQLVDVTSALALRLSAPCPGLQLLFTSRRTLGVASETVYRIPPLAVPETSALRPAALAECESVAMFVDRAQAVRPGFQLTERNAADVAAICRCLEGLPLALELAAARVQVTSPRDLLAALENRLSTLVSRRRDVEPRHRTMRGALAWSYEMLPEGVQAFLRCLSVFPGEFSSDAAAEVCDEPLALDLLAELADWSLLTVEEADDEVAFHLPGVVREYAREQLSGTPTETPAESRFVQYCLRFVRRFADDMRTERETAALSAVEGFLPELRAAIDIGGRLGEGAAVAELCLVSARFLQRLGLPDEAQSRADTGVRVLQAAEAGSDSLIALLHCKRASLAIDRGDWTAASEAAARADELSLEARLPGPQGKAANLLGMAAVGAGDVPAARGHYARALTLYRGAGDTIGIANVHNNIALLEEFCGNPAAALPHLRTALRLRRECGDRRGLVETLVNLGVHAHRKGRMADAWKHYLEGLAIQRQLGDPLALGVILVDIGEVAEARGDTEAAARLFTAALLLLRRVGSPHRGTAEQGLDRVRPGQQPARDERMAEWTPDEMVRYGLGELPPAASTG